MPQPGAMPGVKATALSAAILVSAARVTRANQFGNGMEYYGTVWWILKSLPPPCEAEPLKVGGIDLDTPPSHCAPLRDAEAGWARARCGLTDAREFS